MRFAGTLLVAATICFAQTPENVLVVVNQSSALSKNIGDYYVLKRHIPLANVCRINMPPDEIIPRADYQKKIAAPVANCLARRKLSSTVLYIVTTAGVPLRINGTDGPSADSSAVDSELALLYSEARGVKHRLQGGVPNPFYGMMEAQFRHPDFPIYLVTRLAGYSFADVKALVDRSLVAQNRGKFVIDLKGGDDTQGNQWLREAAGGLPKDRVVFDETRTVLSNEKDVIGYASWGSNDSDRKQRFLGFQWLPGAIMTEYVSTDGRTFARPPDAWTLGNWVDRKTWFAGSPQSMTADYVHEGVTGASGHVNEPYLQMTPHPNILLPAYFHGRNLAESYYLSIPMLSWMNVVIGDPLCSLGPPPKGRE